MADGDVYFELGKKTFTSKINATAQQIQSRLMNTVMLSTEPFLGEFRSSDWMLPTDMHEGETLNGKKPIDTPSEFKRWLKSRYFYKYESIERTKLDSIINNPQSVQMMRIIAAAQRGVDVTIVDALGGPAYQGKDGPTEQVAFPADRVIPHNNEGMTRDKIMAALKLFKDEDLDVDQSGLGLNLTLAWTSNEEHQLLEDPKVQSIEYMIHKFLVDGGINPGEKALGTTYLRTNHLKVDENGIRTCFLYRKDAIDFSWRQPIKPDMYVDKTLMRDPIVLGADMLPAATRTQDTLVAAIQVDTTAGE